VSLKQTAICIVDRTGQNCGRRIAAVIAFAFAASVARAEIQTLQMNPDARGGGVEPADVHLGASSRLTCQQFIALENSVREGAIASGGAYSREMVGWLTP
jgi:hypothetical protein